MDGKFKCVFGVLKTPIGLKIKDEMLEWLYPLFEVFTVEQEPPGTLFEYPAINLVLHMCVETNEPIMYIHTKGAANVNINNTNVRYAWKDQYENHLQDYLNAINIKKPLVVCPWTGPKKTTWFNSWIITPLAASILLKTFHIDKNRFYYESMFKNQPKIEVKGILANDCEHPIDVIETYKAKNLKLQKG